VVSGSQLAGKTFLLVLLCWSCNAAQDLDDEVEVSSGVQSYEIGASKLDQYSISPAEGLLISWAGIPDEIFVGETVDVSVRITNETEREVFFYSNNRNCGCRFKENGARLVLAPSSEAVLTEKVYGVAGVEIWGMKGFLESENQLLGEFELAVPLSVKGLEDLDYSWSGPGNNPPEGSVVINDVPENRAESFSAFVFFDGSEKTFSTENIGENQIVYLPFSLEDCVQSARRTRWDLRALPRVGIKVGNTQTHVDCNGIEDYKSINVIGAIEPFSPFTAILGGIRNAGEIVSVHWIDLGSLHLMKWEFNSSLEQLECTFISTGTLPGRAVGSLWVETISGEERVISDYSVLIKQ